MLDRIETRMRLTATVYIGYEVYIAASTLLQAVFLCMLGSGEKYCLYFSRGVSCFDRLNRSKHIAKQPASNG